MSTVHIGKCTLGQKLFASAEETNQPVKGTISGNVPKWLNGTLYRVGPAKWDFNDKLAMNHIFDGYAILVKFHINFNERKVTMEKKFLKSDAYLRAKAVGKPVIAEFATKAESDPNKGIFRRMMNQLIPELSDNNYCGIFPIGDGLFTASDSCFFSQFDQKSLEPKGKIDSNKYFGVGIQSPHPLKDPVTGITYNLGMQFYPSLKYCFYKIPPAAPKEDLKKLLKQAKTVASISPRWTGAFGCAHSFGMSENYLVLIEPSSCIPMSRIVASLYRHDTLYSWIQPHNQDPARFIIVNKHTGKVVRTEYFLHEPFYFLHVLNCYEENKQIVLDIVAYDSLAMADLYFLEDLRVLTPESSVQSHSRSILKRFVLPIIDEKYHIRIDDNLVTLDYTTCSANLSHEQQKHVLIKGENLSENGLDLVTINPKYFSRKHRYAYACGGIVRSEFTNAVIKLDTHKPTGAIGKWIQNEYLIPGQPLFIPSPGENDEDDGVIMVTVTDCRVNHPDFLLLLDGKTMKELGRVSFDCHIPLTLHGHFDAKKLTNLS